MTLQELAWRVAMACSARAEGGGWHHSCYFTYLLVLLHVRYPRALPPLFSLKEPQETTASISLCPTPFSPPFVLVSPCPTPFSPCTMYYACRSDYRAVVSAEGGRNGEDDEGSEGREGAEGRTRKGERKGDEGRRGGERQTGRRGRGWQQARGSTAH